MRDSTRYWTLESLRRAIIAAVIAALALAADAVWLKATAVIALLVFVFFLLRNPEGWARRISYACTMLGTGQLVGLGSAIQAIGIFEMDGRLEKWPWLGRFVVMIEQSSIWPGLVLLCVGVVFGVIELVRQRDQSRTPTTQDRHRHQIPIIRLSEATEGFRVICTVAVRNPEEYELSIGHIFIEGSRLVDHVLTSNVQLGDVTTLEVSGQTEHSVEFTSNDPVVLYPQTWKRFQIEFHFRDKLLPSSGGFRVFLWLLGLTRRYFNVRFGRGEGEMTFDEVILVQC